jgi:uncharacterized Tic20 family protein
MNFALSAAVMAVMSLLLGYVVHAMLLGPEYAKLAGLFRKQIVFDTIVVVLMGIVCAWINRVRAPAGSAA